MITTAEILAKYHERKELAQPWLGTKLQVRDQFNLRVDIPLPELDRNEKPAVASILNEVVDALSSRAASTQPDVRYMPLKPGDDASERRAQERRKTNLGWWDMDAADLQDSQAYRWLFSYACAPMLIRPNWKRKYPEQSIRDPLACFPAPCDQVGSQTPDDAIFCVTQTYRWLKSRYGSDIRGLRVGDKPRDDDKYEMLEYYDDQEVVLICLGKKPKAEDDYYNSTIPGYDVVELERYPNRSGICPVVVPGLIGLDPNHRAGKFDAMLGMFWNRAKLAALNIHAYEKSIFADAWLEGGDANNPPKIIAKADGRRNIAGIVQNGRIRYERPDPNYNTVPFMREMERHERLEAGAPQELSGESGSNIRTGRRGEQVLSAVIDPPIQEAHKIMQRAKREANIRRIAMDKALWGNEKKSFYVNWKGAKGRVDYVPNKLWETDENYVVYSHAGADVNGVAIAGGQRVGMGTMSKRGFMDMDPMIEDAEQEMDRVVYETLQQATLDSFMTQFTQPGADLNAMARIAQAVVTNRKNVFEAIIEFNDKLKEEQAEAEAQAAQGPPDPMAAQPGLAALTGGAPETPIPGLGEGPQDLSSLLGSLRMPQMSVPSERPQVA